MIPVNPSANINHIHSRKSLIDLTSSKSITGGYSIKNQVMRKIIAAFDGLKYSVSTRQYAIQVAKEGNYHLVGVFLDDKTYSSYKIYELITEEGVSDARLKQYEDKDKATRMAAAKDFEEQCKKAGISFSIHHDQNIAIQDLKHESIYADLLIIDSRETLTHYTEKLPTRFVRDLLTDVQCPVILVPSKYKPLEKVVLLYDGEPSSVFAIKMFSYLMPTYAGLEVEIISVNPVSSSLHLKDNKLMKEFMKRHYPKAAYKILKGLAEDEIIKHLKQQTAGTLVVLGAYRRSAISRWFRESMADVLMKEVKLPLFIAHNK